MDPIVAMTPWQYWTRWALAGVLFLTVLAGVLWLTVTKPLLRAITQTKSQDRSPLVTDGGDR